MTSVGSNLNIFCVDVLMERPSACVRLSLTSTDPSVWTS